MHEIKLKEIKYMRVIEITPDMKYKGARKSHVGKFGVIANEKILIGIYDERDEAVNTTLLIMRHAGHLEGNATVHNMTPKEAKRFGMKEGWTIKTDKGFFGNWETEEAAKSAVRTMLTTKLPEEMIK